LYDLVTAWEPRVERVVERPFRMRISIRQGHRGLAAGMSRIAGRWSRLGALDRRPRRTDRLAVRKPPSVHGHATRHSGVAIVPVTIEEPLRVRLLLATASLQSSASDDLSVYSSAHKFDNRYELVQRVPILGGGLRVS